MADKKTHSEKDKKKKWFMYPKVRDPENKRTHRFKMSMSPNDMKELKEKADKAGISMSEYMYWLFKNKTLHIQNIEFSDTLRKIAGESDNINQIAGKYNLLRYLPEHDVLKLKNLIYKLDNLISEELQYLKINKEE